MEVLFKNTFTRNKELAKQLYTYLHFRRPFMIFFFAVEFAFLALIACLDIMSSQFHLAAYLVVVLFTGLTVYQYFTNVKRMLSRDAELGMEDIQVSSTVTEDTLQYESLGNVSPAVELTNIKKWITTKDFIFLFSKTKLLYIFSKDGFTEGSEEEFYRFLTRKGIKHSR